MSDKKEKKAPKAKPVCPSTYIDGVINMSGRMITTEFDFIQIWGKRYKGQDMIKAYKKARKWRDKFA